MHLPKVAIAAFVAVLSLPTLALSAADAVEGTWKLNVSKSTLSPSIPIKSETRTYTAAGDGIAVTANSEMTTGKTQEVKFTYHYDGKDYPVTGSPLYDSLALKRVNSHTTTATQKLKGAVVGHSQRVISHDGKMMTLTSHMKVDGKETTTKMVYDKQ